MPLKHHVLRLRRTARYGVVACIASGMAGMTSAAELQLAPQRDTSIYNGTPGSGNLADGSGDFLWLSVTAEGLNRRALLRFDLSAIPPGSVVQQVQLALYESRARDGHDVAVHRLQRAWGEGTSNAGGSGAGAPAAAGDATWLNAFHPATPWSQPGGDFVAAPSAVAPVGLPGQFYTWGSTPALLADVQTWVDQPATNHGWILIGNEQGLQNAKRFESRNNAAAANRPRLTVRYDPPPAGNDADIPVPAWALVLLAAAVSARLWRRPRAKRAAGAAE
jgi:hypothetical protein